MFFGSNLFQNFPSNAESLGPIQRVLRHPFFRKPTSLLLLLGVLLGLGDSLGDIRNKPFLHRRVDMLRLFCTLLSTIGAWIATVYKRMFLKCHIRYNVNFRRY